MSEQLSAENDAIRWVVFCAMHPGEERLFDNRSTSELRAMNNRAGGIADALMLAGMRVTPADLSARLAAVEALHRETKVTVAYSDGRPTYTARCAHCNGVWPCQTTAALRPAQSETTGWHRHQTQGVVRDADCPCSHGIRNVPAPDPSPAQGAGAEAAEGRG